MMVSNSKYCDFRFKTLRLKEDIKNSIEIGIKNKVLMKKF